MDETDDDYGDYFVELMAIEYVEANQKGDRPLIKGILSQVIERDSLSVLRFASDVASRVPNWVACGELTVLENRLRNLRRETQHN